MHARIYVENYSREEGNELTLPRNYYSPHFAASASAVPVIMARYAGCGNRSAPRQTLNETLTSLNWPSQPDSLNQTIIEWLRTASVAFASRRC